MTTPSFYDPNRVGTLFAARTALATAEGLVAHNAITVDNSGRKVLLLLVDPQVDFIHKDGTLSVPGAVDDTRRTIDWLYRNIGSVDTIAASMDTHVPFQIFYPSWWIDPDGNHPAPLTPITLQDYYDGKWQPVVRSSSPEPGVEWSEYYLKHLESQAKKTLMIWPYHTMLGTAGYAIEPSLYEAIAFHAAARSAQPQILIKGSIARTENYSILEPEVNDPTHPLGGLNTDFMDMLRKYDLIYIAGQAKSHCVLETITSIVNYFLANAPDVLKRIRVLQDCMSSVVHPDIDFDAIANDVLRDYTRQGLRLVRSTDPIG